MSKKYQPDEKLLFKIKYYLHHNKTSWSSTINQLNSDVLKRHILPKVTTDSFDLDFSFCELTNQGEIRDPQGLVLGSFYISD